MRSANTLIRLTDLSLCWSHKSYCRFCRVLAHISNLCNMSDCRCRGRKFKSQLGYVTFVVIDHEIISMAIIPLPLIQERQLSVTGESTDELLARHGINSVVWTLKLLKTPTQKKKKKKKKQS